MLIWENNICPEQADIFSSVFHFNQALPEQSFIRSNNI